MNHRILILSAIVLAVVFSSCKKMFEDEELSMKRTDYTGTELRTDGYYFYKNADNFHPLFIFNNGVFIHGYTYEISNIGQVEESFKNGTF